MASGSAYLKKRKSALKFLIRTPKRKFNQNRFHVLRVEIKKLKANLYRMEFLLSDFSLKKFYKPFRKLFAQAGRVREIQIEKEILKTYGQNGAIPKYMNYLDKKLRKERTRFFEVRNFKLNSKIQRRLKDFGKRINELEKLDSGPFLKNLIGEIKPLLTKGALETKSAHLLRKKLKNLKYNLECLEGGKFITNHPNQEELANLLGSWHDLVTVHSTIQSHLTNAPIPAEEKETLKKINGNIKSSASEIFEKINQKVATFDDFLFSPKLKIRANGGDDYSI